MPYALWETYMQMQPRGVSARKGSRRASKKEVQTNGECMCEAEISLIDWRLWSRRTRMGTSLTTRRARCLEGQAVRWPQQSGARRRKEWVQTLFSLLAENLWPYRRTPRGTIAAAHPSLLILGARDIIAGPSGRVLSDRPRA